MISRITTSESPTNFKTPKAIQFSSCPFLIITRGPNTVTGSAVTELLFGPRRRSPSPWIGSFPASLRKSSSIAASGTLMANSVSSRNGVYTVGDFMTRKEELHVVKSTTSVKEALEILVEERITGFPVIDDNWKLVGVVSD